MAKHLLCRKDESCCLILHHNERFAQEKNTKSEKIDFPHKSVRFIL